MKTFTLTEPIEADILEEAYEEFIDQYSRCESSIVKLEHKSENNKEYKRKLDDLFRTVHTVKANIGLMGFIPMVGILQELETILDFVRKQTLEFTNLVGDLILLLMDQVRNFIQQFYDKREVIFDNVLFNDINIGLKGLAAFSGKDPSPLLIDLIVRIDPATGEQYQTGRNWLTRIANENNDLEFLYSLATTSEQRVGYWQGRTDRIGKLALQMNETAGNPVNPINLAASLMIHDIAMAFLPSTLLNQTSALSSKQKTLVKQHVKTSSQLMRSMFDSHLAGQDLMQHQERADGSGYPNGLTDKEINSGAKIIAIVHAFEAITHGHTSVTLRKRPFMRAMLEINKKAGIDFNEYWVEVFMKVLKKNH